MRQIQFRAWYIPDQKMYFRAYQKFFHILLCIDDQGENEGKGLPEREAAFGDCVLMECTDLTDESDSLIFEGDILKVKTATGEAEVRVSSIPDMFRSRGLHPLADCLTSSGIHPEDILSYRITGNIYQGNHS